MPPPDSQPTARPFLSVCVITGNEEDNIGRCLESVAFADEIVVVDSFSTDRTVAIARSFTDRVFQHRWVGPAGTPEDTTTVYVVTAGRPESAFIAEPSALRKATRTVKQEARHAD